MSAITERRRVLHLHPQRADVLVERVEGAPPLFVLICTRHQYAAPGVDRMEQLGGCPKCFAEAEAGPGLARYRDLHGANVRIEGWR